VTVAEKGHTYKWVLGTDKKKKQVTNYKNRTSKKT
jgi:hypothetical protein